MRHPAKATLTRRYGAPLLTLAVLLSANHAGAQVSPSLGYAYPPVVKIGQTTKVQLGGFDLTDDTDVVSHRDEVRIRQLGLPGRFFVPEPPYWFGPKGFATAYKIPREIPTEISVASGLAEGLAHWQVTNANGSSATAVLYLSGGSELLEEDRFRNSDVQSLPEFPVAVSGRIRKIAEVDRYRFRALNDGPVSVELFARRLGSDMNGVLEVRDENGRRIVDSADTEGLDTAVTFRVAKGREYTLALHDADFRGNRAYVYRLAFRAAPRVVTTIPAKLTRGATREVTFLGYGVATGHAKIETTRRELTAPGDPNQRSLVYRLSTPHGEAAAIEIPLSDLPERTEGDAVRPMVAPQAVTGVLDDSGVDRFLWQAKKGERWAISLESRAIGGPLDVALLIEDENGKKLAENDDFGGASDASLAFTAPADGAYRCVVRDVSGKSGTPLAVYRLSVARPAPGFAMTAPQQVKIAQGGVFQLAVKATRQGGFDGPIALRVEGLPEGVTAAEDVTIAKGKKDAKVPITVDAKAGTAPALIRVRGEATIGNETIVHFAKAPLTGNLCPRDKLNQVTNRLIYQATLTPPFDLKLEDKNRQRAVHRGTTYPAPFQVVRNEGYSGEITVQMAGGQGRHRQGITAPQIKVPAGVVKVLYPCFMPEWLATDRTTRMAVIGVAPVKDPKGRVRSITKAADARITMILEGALLKLRSRPAEITARLGDAFTAPLAVSRSSKLTEQVRVELVVPPELDGLLEATAVTLPLETSEADLVIRTRPDPRLSGMWKLRFRATAVQSQKWPVVSETELIVEFLPPAAASQ